MNFVNNLYNGPLDPAITSKLSIGATDLGLLNAKLTKGSKLRFNCRSVKSKMNTSSSLCNIQNDDSTTLTTVEMILEVMTWGEKNCIDMFYDTDYAIGFDIPSLSSDLISGAIADQLDAKEEQTQYLRWSGDVALGDRHDGLLTLLLAKGANSVANPTGYQQVASTTLTVANVVNEIKKVIFALPRKVTSNRDFKVILGEKAASLLLQAMSRQTGVNNLPPANFDVTTGRITDNFFGFSVYGNSGIDGAYEEVIVAGLFGTGSVNPFKVGYNTPSAKPRVQVRMLESDELHFKYVHAQAVALADDCSQVSMNK